MFDTLTPDDEYLSCDICAAFGQCDDHIDPYSDEFDYDDPFDVVMYDIDTEADDLYALIDMLGDSARSWYARRRLNSLAASGSLRALVADIIIDSLGRRWNPLEHPRDRFGRFISTGGFFRWLGGGGKWARARVERIDSDGVIHARSVGNDHIPDGQLVRFKPEQSSKMVSVADPLADLSSGPEFQEKYALDLDADIPDFPDASATQKRMYNALRDGNMPAEDLDRFFISEGEVSQEDFISQLEDLRDRGLVEIDTTGTRPRVQRTDMPEADEVDVDEVIDVPDNEVPELDDSPALTKEQRDLLDFITDLDRGEGDGVAFEELDDVGEANIQALIDAGVLDETDGRLHLVNPEEGVSDLNAPETPAPEMPEEDILGEVFDAAKVLDDPVAQDAFQHFALQLAAPEQANEFPLSDGLPAGKRRNAEQAAQRWWAERNGEVETPDPNVDPDAAKPQDVLNPRNQALADGLAEQWILDEAFLDKPDGEEYRGALKRLFDAADLEENGFENEAKIERLRAERGFLRAGAPQEDIDGWPQHVQDARENDLAEPAPDVAPEEVVPEEVAPEADAIDVPVVLEDRPSYALYTRKDPDFQGLLDEGAEEYEWGALAADKDIAAGLPPMSDENHGNLWGADSVYAEGYRDAYGDNERFNEPEVPATNDVPRDDDAALDELLAEEPTPVSGPGQALEQDGNPWDDYEARLRADGEADNYQDRIEQENRLAGLVGIDLVDDTDGRVTWNFMAKMLESDEAAERLFNDSGGSLGKAASLYMNDPDKYKAPSAAPAEDDELAVEEVDLPATPTPDANIPLAPATGAVPIADVPEHAALLKQEPFNIDDYPYITEDGRGLANREGAIVELGKWYQANRGGEGDLNEAVGFYDQEKFPGWVLVRAPDGKLKAAHVLGRGEGRQGGLNNIIPPDQFAGALDAWRAQRAARGGDVVDLLDQFNPKNVMRRGGPAEVGQAVHYLGGGKKFGDDNNGVVARIGWNSKLQQPIIYVLVPGQNGNKATEVPVAPRMLEPRRDPVTALPSPSVPDAPNSGGPVLPVREWQIPNDDELIGRIQALGGDADLIDFTNAFVNPGAVFNQIDALINTGKLKRVKGNNDRWYVRVADDDEAPGVVEAVLPDGAENIFEGNMLNALDDAGDTGLPRGALIDLDGDDITEQLDALRSLQDRGVIERDVNTDGKPVFRRIPAAPEAGVDGAENEVEADLLNVIDNLGRDARGGDLMDADADDLEEKMDALRALVDRGVLRRVVDPATGKPVYRRPSSGSSTPVSMTDAEALAALQAGGDPVMINNNNLVKLMERAGYRFIPNGERGISPNDWAIANEKGEFPVSLPGHGPVDGKVYMVKRSSKSIPDDMLNEVLASAISEDLRERLGRESPGLLYHPRVSFAEEPFGMGSRAGGAVIMDHAAYGYSAQDELFGGRALNNKPNARSADHDIIGLGLYDYMINNIQDRHNGNQMYVRNPVTGEIKVVVIDNGYGFGAVGRPSLSFEEYVQEYRPADLFRRTDRDDRATVEKAVRDFVFSYQQMDLDATIERVRALFPGRSPEQDAYIVKWLTVAKQRADALALDISAVVDTIVAL